MKTDASNRSLHSPVLPTFGPTTDIGGASVGGGAPCYIIAEAGSNHDGELDVALQLVDAAAAAKSNAVKFQSFRGDDIAARFESPDTALPEEFLRWGKTLIELYESCALPDSFYAPLKERADEHGIAFLSTPFSEEQVDKLVKLGVPALKIASFELVHLPLVRHAASSGLPLIISTGMAGLGDIERALEAAADGGARQVVILHCGSSYPLDDSAANLGAMATLRSAFEVPVGYSDHTLGIAVPIAAAALGCSVLEKHFTLDRTRPGPDHPFAIEPDELRQMVEGVRTAELAAGSTRKTRHPSEHDAARRGRRSLFAAVDVEAGTPLRREHIKVVRPGVGLEPFVLPVVLGRPLVRKLERDQPLVWDHLLGALEP